VADAGHFIWHAAARTPKHPSERPANWLILYFFVGLTLLALYTMTFGEPSIY
jgi:hypothetical protein